MEAIVYLQRERGEDEDNTKIPFRLTVQSTHNQESPQACSHPVVADRIYKRLECIGFAICGFGFGCELCCDCMHAAGYVILPLPLSIRCVTLTFVLAAEVGAYGRNWNIFSCLSANNLLLCFVQ